jgi:hypothetical protein
LQNCVVDFATLFLFIFLNTPRLSIYALVVKEVSYGLIRVRGRNQTLEMLLYLVLRRMVYEGVTNMTM